MDLPWNLSSSSWNYILSYEFRVTAESKSAIRYVLIFWSICSSILVFYKLGGALVSNRSEASICLEKYCHSTLCQPRAQSQITSTNHKTVQLITVPAGYTGYGVYCLRTLSQTLHAYLLVLGHSQQDTNVPVLKRRDCEIINCCICPVLLLKPQKFLAFFFRPFSIFSRNVALVISMVIWCWKERLWQFPWPFWMHLKCDVGNFHGPFWMLVLIWCRKFLWPFWLLVQNMTLKISMVTLRMSELWLWKFPWPFCEYETIRVLPILLPIFLPGIW